MRLKPAVSGAGAVAANRACRQMNGHDDGVRPASADPDNYLCAHAAAADSFLVKEPGLGLDVHASVHDGPSAPDAHNLSTRQRPSGAAAVARPRIVRSRVLMENTVGIAAVGVV